MSRVSKEDMDFLHLLTHLRVKDMEEKAWVSIIQSMEGKCKTPTQQSNDSGTVPSNTGTMTWDTAPLVQDATPANDKETPGRNFGTDRAMTCKDTMP